MVAAGANPNQAMTQAGIFALILLPIWINGDMLAPWIRALGLGAAVFLWQTTPLGAGGFGALGMACTIFGYRMSKRVEEAAQL